MSNNQEELLKKCLEFYADETNHKNGMILIDNGLYAKQVLDIYKTVKDRMNEQVELFDSMKNDDEVLEKYIKDLSNL
jgi:hypothetical protein